MGGKSGSKKTTVGYRYYMGIHMGLCRGPVNELLQIRVGDLLAWSGSMTASGDVSIDQPNLFGGDSREGGIQGTLSVLMGSSDQPVHAGLSSMLGGLVPAFRGVVSLFFDGLICSMGPYPKPWVMRVRRTSAGWRDGCWYSAKVSIPLIGGEISAVGGEVQAITAMNPAHILYECLTNPDWGRGLDAARIDDAGWRSAADTLAAEGFGLCIKWSRQDKLSTFMQEILDTIGGVLFVDRLTGLIKLQLIRADYDAGALPLFDADHGFLGITEDDNGAATEAVNEVIVTYHSPVDNADHQVRVRSLGAVHAAAGRRSSTTAEYAGIPTAALAARVAQRDLAARSGFIKRFQVRLDRRGHAIQSGDVFRISDPTRGIASMVLRAGRVEYGDISDGTIVVTAMTDLFGLPTTAFVDFEPAVGSRPDSTAVAVSTMRLFEVSYRDLAQYLDAANLSLIDATSAWCGAVAARPSVMSLGYQLLTRVFGSSDFVERGDTPFTPTAVLAADIGPDTLTFSVGGAAQLDEVRIGTAALLGDEVVRVDALVASTGLLTVARGCADTVPIAHASGTRLWFYDDFAGADSTEYSSGLVVEAIALPFTSTAVLGIGSASVYSLTLDQRAYCPYPPGALQFNGVAYPETVSGEITVSWSHRDRLLQADQLVDTSAGHIGPEAGTSYRLRIYLGATLLRTYTTSSTSQVYLSADEIADGGPFSTLRFVLDSFRDGVYSRQAHDWTVSRA